MAASRPHRRKGAEQQFFIFNSAASDAPKQKSKTFIWIFLSNSQACLSAQSGNFKKGKPPFGGVPADVKLKSCSDAIPAFFQTAVMAEAVGKDSAEE